jgi:hypothetical protein
VPFSAVAQRPYPLPCEPFGVMLRPMNMAGRWLAVLPLVLLTACSGGGTKDNSYGTTAVWEADPSDPPTATGRQFTALVTRLACSGGVTGPVRDPKVVEGTDRIVVTFTLNALPEGAYNCLGGRPVPHAVRLTRPLGHRVIVDGACSSKAKDAPKSCLAEGQRWPKP